MKSSNSERHFPLCGCDVRYGAEVIEFNDFRSNFMEMSRKRRVEFKEFYQEQVKSYEMLYRTAIPLYLIYVKEAVSFSVFVLMNYGIDDIDDDYFVELLGEDSIGYEDVLSAFGETAELLEQAEATIREHRANQRSGRSHWQGGGFGIRGAITGAVKAGAMNLVTDAVRGIGDSFTDSRDRAQIEKLKNEVVNNPNNLNIFNDALRGAYFACFRLTYEILCNEGIMSPVIEDTSRIKRLINNYMNIGDRSKSISLLREAIEKDPYDEIYYFKLYQLTGNERYDQIYKLAKFFDVDEEFLEMVREYKDEN